MNMNNKSKRVLLILISVLFVSVINTQAQSKPKDSKIIKYTTVALDTAFKHRNQNISVRLIVANDTSKIYYAVIRPSDTTPRYLISERDPLFYFEYSDTLSSTLLKVVAKYREWKKIADEHQTAELVKVIDIETPLKYMSLRNYTHRNFKWANPTTKKFSFVLRDRKIGSSISIAETIDDIEGMQNVHLILTDKDLETIANLLDYKTLMNKLKKESEDALFK